MSRIRCVFVGFLRGDFLIFRRSTRPAHSRSKAANSTHDIRPNFSHDSAGNAIIIPAYTIAHSNAM